MSRPRQDFALGEIIIEKASHEPRRCKVAGTAPPAGTNVVVVTHKPNILDAFGKDWFDVREGEASVLKPNGSGGFSVVAKVQADDWTKLAQGAR